MKKIVFNSLLFVFSLFSTLSCSNEEISLDFNGNREGLAENMPLLANNLRANVLDFNASKNVQNIEKVCESYQELKKVWRSFVISNGFVGYGLIPELQAYTSICEIPDGEFSSAVRAYKGSLSEKIYETDYAMSALGLQIYRDGKLKPLQQLDEVVSFNLDIYSKVAQTNLEDLSININK